MFAEVMMQDYVLRTWRNNPDAPRSSYLMVGWRTGPGSDLPLTVAEIDRRKDWMRRNAPKCYYLIFPEEDHDGEAAG